MIIGSAQYGLLLFLETKNASGLFASLVPHIVLGGWTKYYTVKNVQVAGLNGKWPRPLPPRIWPLINKWIAFFYFPAWLKYGIDSKAAINELEFFMIWKRIVHLMTQWQRLPMQNCVSTTGIWLKKQMFINSSQPSQHDGQFEGDDGYGSAGNFQAKPVSIWSNTDATQTFKIYKDSTSYWTRILVSIWIIRERCTWLSLSATEWEGNENFIEAANFVKTVKL